MTEVGLLQDEPSMLLMDLGGWTVDRMRIDNAIPAADTAHSLEPVSYTHLDPDKTAGGADVSALHI